MGGLKAVIADVAIVAVLATFIDIFLPKGNSNYGIKLVFGLYFLAILLNPAIALFTSTDLSTLDFTKLSTTDSWQTTEVEDEIILKKAAESLGNEIAVRLRALNENGNFNVKVAMATDDINSVIVDVGGIAKGKERTFADGIKEFIAGEYGIKISKVEVVYK